MLALTLNVCSAAPRADVALSPDIKQWYPDGDVINYCVKGLLNSHNEICCPKSCISCGGTDCSGRPGGAHDCCLEDIERSHNYCRNQDTVRCIMPLTCDEDRCLLHCPLDPSCSVIWKSRGRDYMQMRKEYQEQNPDSVIE